MEDGDEEQVQSQAGICQEEVDALVSGVVRHMLFKNFQQPGVPVKREELTHIVSKTYRQRHLPATVIKQAEKMLRSVFGMQLVELEKVRQQHRGRGNVAEAPKEYVLRTCLPAVLRDKYVETKESRAWRGLIATVVGIIYVSGEKCSEENFWLHMEKLGISETEENHPVFGNIKQAMESMMKQRYIQKEKAEEGFVYSLAENALDKKVIDKSKEWIKRLVQGDDEEVEETEETEETEDAEEVSDSEDES